MSDDQDDIDEPILPHDDISDSSEDHKHEDAQPPSVKGEEDVFSGDMPEEAADIDEEMEKIGKDLDPEHPEPLGD